MLSLSRIGHNRHNLPLQYVLKNLHDAGSGSFGALTAKYYASKGLDFKTFEKIYFSTVVPITDYAAGVWGFKAYDEHDKLQNRVIRMFLDQGNGRVY